MFIYCNISDILKLNSLVIQNPNLTVSCVLSGKPVCHSQNPALPWGVEAEKSGQALESKQRSRSEQPRSCWVWGQSGSEDQDQSEAHTPCKQIRGQVAQCPLSDFQRGPPCPALQAPGICTEQRSPFFLLCLGQLFHPPQICLLLWKLPPTVSYQLTSSGLQCSFKYLWHVIKTIYSHLCALSPLNHEPFEESWIKAVYKAIRPHLLFYSSEPGLPGPHLRDSWRCSLMR